MRIRVLAVAAALVLTAGAASAQPATEAAPRGSVSVFSGFEFVLDGGADVLIAAEYGEHVTPDVQAYVAFTYFEDLMSPGVQDEVADLSAGLGVLTGTPWDLTARDRGVSLVGGAKVFGSRGSRARPYFGAGAGVLNLRRTIREARVGDVTTAVFNDFGVGQAELAVGSQTVPVVELLGGLGYFAARNTYIEIGYRYRRPFRLTDGLHMSQISAGIGYRF
jgi:hypothetical protein